MKNDTVAMKIIDGIYDITPIIKPSPSLIENSILFILVTLSISIAVYFIWNIYISKKATSQRKINSLQAKYINNKINTRDTIYKLCLILREGLEINKISKQTYLPNKASINRKKWDGFSDEMSVLRYENNSELDISHLFEESVFWLRNWS